MPKSAREKLASEALPRRKRLEKAFAGVPAGKMLYVATPRIVADYISTIPCGQERTIPQMRDDLAKAAGCDATCPVSTAIFVRVAAEAALEDIDEGVSASDVIPFWRIIGPDEKIAARLPIDRQWIADRRAAETA